MTGWDSFFQGELGAAAALGGLLFVSMSVNQARILELGRMADRGLEALAMLFLVLVVASLALIPAQPPRWLGGEISFAALLTLAVLAPVQSRYLAATDPLHRPSSRVVAWGGRAAIALIGLAGLVLLGSGGLGGVYLLAAGVLLSFGVVGINAWVLLIEINR
jgi:hypothetical protein